MPATAPPRRNEVLEVLELPGVVAFECVGVPGVLQRLIDTVRLDTLLGWTRWSTSSAQGAVRSTAAPERWRTTWPRWSASPSSA